MRNIINQLTVFFTILQIFSGFLIAEIRPYSGEFLKSAIGVREISLGNAALSISEGPSSGFWNPANLPFRNEVQLEVMHTEQFDASVNVDYMGLTVQRNNLNFAFLLFRNGVDAIPYTNNALLDYGEDGIPGTNDPGENNGKLDDGERLDNDKIKYIGTAEWAGYFSVAKKLNPKTYLGLSVKTIHQNLYRRKSLGLGFDIATTRLVGKNYRLSVILKDALTTFILWDDGILENIAPSLHISGTTFFDLPSGNMRIIPVASIMINAQEQSFYSNISAGPVGIYVNYGTEIILNKLIALRLGKNENEYWNFGIGLNSSLMELNYGFVPGSTELGTSHLVSLNFHIRNLIEFLSS